MRSLYAILVAVIFVCIWASLSFYFAFPDILHLFISGDNNADIEKALTDLKNEKLIIYYNHTAIIALIIIDYVYSLIKKYGGVNIGGVYLALLVAFFLCLIMSLVTIYLMRNDNISILTLGLCFVISIVLAKFFTLFTPHKLEKIN